MPGVADGVVAREQAGEGAGGQVQCSVHTSGVEVGEVGVVGDGGVRGVPDLLGD